MGDIFLSSSVYTEYTTYSGTKYCLSDFRLNLPIVSKTEVLAVTAKERLGLISYFEKNPTSIFSVQFGQSNL